MRHPAFHILLIESHTGKQSRVRRVQSNWKTQFLELFVHVRAEMWSLYCIFFKNNGISLVMWEVSKYRVTTPSECLCLMKELLLHGYRDNGLGEYEK